MNTIAYIDRGNLYHGLLKGRPECKWLDLFAFAGRLLDGRHTLVSVKYFTARVKTHPHDAAAVERQNIYLQALAAHGGVRIIEGYYNKNKARLPAVRSACRNCPSAAGGFVDVFKMEEKRTDVNLVMELLRDAYANAAEAFAIVSGDADFIAPLDLVRHERGKQVVVFNPHSRPTDLRNHATYCANIPRDLPSRCQLPDAVPLPNGRTLRRPAVWMPPPS